MELKYSIPSLLSETSLRSNEKKGIIKKLSTRHSSLPNIEAPGYKRIQDIIKNANKGL